MTFLVLDSHKEDLKFLQNQPTQILTDFCKLASKFLNKGINSKLYQAASQKLHIDVEEIESGVEGLAFLFIEAGRHQLNEEGFKEAVTNLGLEEDKFKIIYDEYLNQKNIIDSVLSQFGFQHFQFKDLEWRFETQVSSKSMRNQLQTRVVLKLELEKGPNIERICLQSNIANIIHMNQILYQALQESRTQHSKRIKRITT